MVPLDVAATWTRMLSVTAGAPAAIGAPGPATRVGGKAALSWIEGPWLGILDFEGVKRCEREVLDPWLWRHGEPLLLVRHLLLAKPLSDEVFIDLTAQAREAMPEGWRDAPRPVLILAPAVTGAPEFERAFRIQQNTLEQLIWFLPSLWLFAFYVSPTWGGILGLVWVGGRIHYALSYYRDPEARGPGFITGFASAAAEPAWSTCP